MSIARAWSAWSPGRTNLCRSRVERCLAEVAHLLDGCKEGDRVKKDLMREELTVVQHQSVELDVKSVSGPESTLVQFCPPPGSFLQRSLWIKREVYGASAYLDASRSTTRAHLLCIALRVESDVGRAAVR